MRTFQILGCIAIIALMVDPAVAQVPKGPPPGVPKGPPPKGAPAPLIGVGLPMVGSVLVALLLVRRFRRKRLGASAPAGWAACTVKIAIADPHADRASCLLPARVANARGSLSWRSHD